jgi:hypothetical protein
LAAIIYGLVVSFDGSKLNTATSVKDGLGKVVDNVNTGSHFGLANKPFSWLSASLIAATLLVLVVWCCSRRGNKQDDQNRLTDAGGNFGRQPGTQNGGSLLEDQLPNNGSSLIIGVGPTGEGYS